MCAAFEIEAGWSFGAFKLLPRLKIVHGLPNTSDVLEIRVVWPQTLPLLLPNFDPAEGRKFLPRPLRPSIASSFLSFSI